MSSQNQNTTNPAHLVQEQLGTHIAIALKYPFKNGLGETVANLKCVVPKWAICEQLGK
ncbi:hypothetical protein [Moraxella nonliquefaciens]|uniref:hypothetical protein n=1 Tax=Moraxella nonliquefaciens TaxID=478 RepID=UPI003EDF89C4